ncbi:hypothetical protein ARMGADRAFT_1087674 [Armillaria gallica]|uniref:Uncharacterized protein n=1 Tax=Armillaria gallica TaxID=47427 RepID=A0A2H3D364_ARMGA|nr:hypothetical protein ARMGADRAFT_1087674 [Armillaria gallica]
MISLRVAGSSVTRLIYYRWCRCFPPSVPKSCDNAAHDYWDKYYAAADGDACLASVLGYHRLSKSQRSSHRLTTNDLCPLPIHGTIIPRTSRDVVISLYYADSYGLVVSIILEPHECVQVEYFCIRQSMVIIELASFSSIVAFTDRAEREIERLDILVENAGMLTWEYEQVEGWERILHANNLGPGLLAISA